MSFYTDEECMQWLAGRARQLPEKENALTHTVSFPRFGYKLYGLASWICENLVMRNDVMIWITSWSVWDYDGLLYYRLRQSYGDHRLINEAPGHYFLPHEGDDFVSFLHLALLNGWDGYVLIHSGNADVFFSHDEYMVFYACHEQTLGEIKAYPPFSGNSL
jgi:hypothetical protein